MKSKNFFFMIIILLLPSNILLAHGDEDHSKQSQDTSVVMAEVAITEESNSHQHPTMDNHLMIKESQIVDAKMSDFSNLHPLVVHFPIVLLLLAFFAQIASLFLWKKQFDWATLLLLLGGFAGAYIASTFVHPHTTDLSEAATLVLEKHDLFADYTLWLSGIGLLLKGISLLLYKDKIWLEIIIALLLGGAAYSVSQAGHYGATLAHIHGVGIQGKFIESNDDGHDHNH